MAQRCISVSIILYHQTYQGPNIKIGFIAFTTIGYGDLAPQTAIGRSIFVFWALFGVGAMTVLFASTSSELRSLLVTFSCATVVSDAFSTKYHNVTHDKRFDRAVRRYQQGQEKSVMNNKKDENGELRNQRPALPEFRRGRPRRLAVHRNPR